MQHTEKVEDGEEVTVEEVEDEQSKMDGMASIALLPDGSISGHFVHLPHSVCYGIHGTGISELHRCIFYCITSLFQIPLKLICLSPSLKDVFGH